ncbi:MAG TPA: cell division protein CrgA [Acidimicrobiia bacterium]|nr:cell division protein CrgA [Acidimicrobiia bacterium]
MPSSQSPGKGTSKSAAKSPAKAAGKPSGKAATAKPAAPPQRGSRRYTPPAAKGSKQSSLWVPVAMFTCLALGIVVIAGNYLQLLPGGETSNNFLIIGLVLLIAGFVLSTMFR